MRCVMGNARSPKFQLSGPTVHSLYCAIDTAQRLDINSLHNSLIYSDGARTDDFKKQYLYQPKISDNILYVVYVERT